MKCIIIDDEPLAREGMKMNLADTPSLELVGVFENAVQANEFVQNNEVDLMFLDIQMPEITGLDFIKLLRNPPMVIITTAFQNYALESFELSVVDYLVKPINPERFIKAVNKADEIFNLRKIASSTKQTKPQPATQKDDFIFVKADRKYVKVKFDNINYIEGLKDYVIIHTDNDRIITAMNVKTIENQLPSDVFFRINRSFIININHIKEVENNSVKIKNKEVPIGNSYKKDFLEQVVIKKLVKR